MNNLTSKNSLLSLYTVNVNSHSFLLGVHDKDSVLKSKIKTALYVTYSVRTS